jgi:hypothetical protein
MSGTIRNSSFEEVSQSQRRSIACGLLTGVVFVSAVVLARRISGDASPIAEWAACLIGLLAVGIAVLCATIPGVLREQLEISDRLLATGLASIPGLLLGLSLLPPGSVAGVSSLLGIYVVAVVSGTLGGAVFPQPNVNFAKPPSSQDSLSSRGGNSDVVVSTEPDETVTEQREPVILAEPTDDWPVTGLQGDSTPQELSLQTETISHPSENPQTTQWMSRSVTSEGETAEGGCQAIFEPGQKLVAVHIPFAPAFDSLPDIECEPLDDSDVKIKVSTRHRYGVRVEVTRLDDLVAAQSIPLGWFAFAATDATAEQIAA